MRSLEELYDCCPSLKVSDRCVAKSVPGRLWILDLLPKESVGAELGVFTGMFSEQIVRIVNPKRLYLVDLWWKDGEVFSWGKEFTDFGRLSTRIAYEATGIRTAGATEALRVVENA
jgi:hypothetical protein